MKRIFLPACVLLALAAADAAAAQLEVLLEPPKKALRDNVAAYIGPLNGRDAAALRRFARSAEREAAQALQALGYYRASIRSEVASEGGKDILRLRIVAGEPVRLRHVEIRVEGEAAGLAALRLPDSPRLRPGARLDHGAYEDAKRLIRNQAQRFGFFDGAFVAQELRVDPAAGVADIRLVYRSGPRYRLGAVAFSGKTPFDEALLRRLVPFKAGEPYDSDRLGALNQALVSSGYFADVQVEAPPERAAGQVIPVLVRLQARKPRTLAAGLGFSTDVGPRLRGTWTRHWRAPSGHRIGSDFEFSAPRQSLSG